MNVPTKPKKTASARKRWTPQQLRDLDLEITFMEGLLKREPDYVDALQLLGDNYTKRERFEDGLRIDEQLCQLRPQDPMVRYNLACSYSLTRQCESAADALHSAVDLGYQDFKWMAKDPDLKNLREHDAYKKIQARIRGLTVKRV